MTRKNPKLQYQLYVNEDGIVCAAVSASVDLDPIVQDPKEGAYLRLYEGSGDDLIKALGAAVTNLPARIVRGFTVVVFVYFTPADLPVKKRKGAAKVFNQRSRLARQVEWFTKQWGPLEEDRKMNVKDHEIDFVLCGF